MPKLVIFRGDNVEHEIRLSGNTLRIGRHSRNDVVLDDAANGVSRFHAEVRPERGNYVIVDLESRNGVWIGGRRIKEKAPLALGVPATLGGFELTLEDDVSTGEFAPISGNNASTVMSGSARTAATGQTASGASSSSAARPPLPANKRQTLIWGGTAAALVLIAVITFAVVRSKTQPPPPPEVKTEPATPAPPVEPTPPQPTQEEIRKQQVAQHLEEARTQMGANDYAGALRDHLNPALEIDPENAQALAMKKEADDAVAAAQAATQRAARGSSKPVEPAEPDLPGIPHRQGETSAEYATRARRIQQAYSEGRASAEKNDYAGALAQFRSIERDQLRYLNVEALIAETQGKQQRAVEEAVLSGQQNEAAGKLREARLWYQKALEHDSGSATARDRAAQARSRATAAANELFTKASAAEKLNETNRAIQYYQEIVSTMLPGDEIRDRAAKRVEALKQ